MRDTAVALRVRQRVVGGAKAKRIGAGAVLHRREFRAISGDVVSVPDGEQLIHLQFRRFAGCPVCNMHLRSLVRRRDEIEAASIREVVVFHAPADELRVHAEDLPFAVVADPDKRLYVAFGVESSPRAWLHPRAWAPVLKALAQSVWSIARKQAPLPAARPHGGGLGLPADFLIARDGRVLASHYGAHAYDQWSVEELLDLAESADGGGC